AGDRRGDAAALGDVVHQEGDGEEGAERELAGGVRGTDRQPLAAVVQAGPGGYQGGERRSLEGRGPVALAGRREPLGEEGQAEVAGGHAEQDQAGPLETAGQRRVELE